MMEPNSAAANQSLTTESRMSRSKSRQAAHVIKQRIKRGIYTPGELLPSIRSLGAELNLTLPAVQRAIRRLEAEGLLESHHGIGTQVLSSADCRTTPLLFAFVQPYSSYYSIMIERSIEDALDSRSNLCVAKCTRNDARREREQIEKLVNSGINGLLIWPVDDDPNGEFLQQIARRVPVVFVDRTLEGVRASSVVLNYKKAGRDIVRRCASEGERRLLAVCDPVNISSFNQLKGGMREEAARLGSTFSLTVVDYPIIGVLEASQCYDFESVDRCFRDLEAMVESGDYDALFCPFADAFDRVFAQPHRAQALGGIRCCTLTNVTSPPQSRDYYSLRMEEWLVDSGRMLKLAIDLLQDMALRRSSLSRTIHVPIIRAR